MISALFIINNKQYTIECEESWTILDALETLRNNTSTPIHYRHSCHHGSCGTCGAIINGIEGLMCLTKINELLQERKSLNGKGIITPKFDNGRLVVILEPLKKASIISGIAVYPHDLFQSIPEELSYKKIITRNDAIQLEADDSYTILYEEYNRDTQYTGAPIPEESVFIEKALQRNKLELCIECGLCLSSCPENFRGPAGLAAIHVDLHKHPTDDETYKKLLELARASDGFPGCKRHINCSRVCPQGVAPARRIQELRIIKDDE